MILNWKVTRAEADIIGDIVKRAATMVKVNHQELNMDIAAVHLNGCPLDLAELLKAETSDFTHDVFGIAMYINRETGQLGECFTPRLRLETEAA